MKWYKNVYRRQLTDMHVADDKSEYLSLFDAEKYYEHLKRAHIQSPMIYLQSHTGLCNYPTTVAKTHAKMTGENNGIKQLINICKKDGLKVVGYYSLIFNNVAADMHPDWEMRYADGSTWRDKGQRYGLCCPNNEEYRKFVKENVTELAAYFTDLDGIFYDMPYWEVACRCESCKKRYKKETGEDLPEKEDWNNDNWLLFVKKRQDWMADFVRYVKKLSKAFMPKTTAEFNFAAVIGCDWLGGSTEDINAECEFTGGDLYGDLYSHSFTAKYYYGITKNQPFEYMTCRCNKNLREHTITKPQEMLDAEIMLTCAHHGATLNIDAINPDGTLDERVYERVGKAFEKQMPYEKYMSKGELYADVAVYFDSKTMFEEPYAKTYNKLCAVNAHKTLVEKHVATAIIANGSLDNLGKYPMIIAPCLQDFPNDEPLKFIEYVKNGGTLYLSGRSDSRLMKEFFGAKFVGYTFGDSKFPHVYKGYNEVQSYIAPEGEYKEIFGEFNDKYPLPITYKLPVYSLKGSVKANIVLPYTDPDNNRTFASIHSNPPAEKTDIPAIVEVNYGKGKVIWVDALIENDERVNFKDIFGRIVLENVQPKYEITASKLIESVIFEDKNNVYISLVNLDPCYEKVTFNKGLTLAGEIKGIGNCAGISFYELNNQTLTNNKYDYIPPQIDTTRADCFGEKDINTLVTVGDFFASDVISPYTRVVYSVKGPDGKFIVSNEGKELNEVDGSEINTFVVKSYGSYYVTILAIDQNNNDQPIPYRIIVTDYTPPVIKLTDAVTSGRINSAIAFAKYSIENDKGSHTAFITVLDPTGTITYYGEKTSFTPTGKGVYTVTVSVVDKNNNLAEVSYTITVS